jgi:ABC-type taurine transport system substrate-binding protein
MRPNQRKLRRIPCQESLRRLLLVRDVYLCNLNAGFARDPCARAEIDAASVPSPAVSDASSSVIEEAPDIAQTAAPVLHELDIDVADAGDQFAVAEYTTEIFAHLRQAEVR